MRKWTRQPPAGSALSQLALSLDPIRVYRLGITGTTVRDALSGDVMDTYNGTITQSVVASGLALNFSSANASLTNDSFGWEGRSEMTVVLEIKADSVGQDGSILTGVISADEGDFTIRYDDVGFQSTEDDCLKVNFGNCQVETEGGIQTTNTQRIVVTWKENDHLSVFVDGRKLTNAYQSLAAGTIAIAGALGIGGLATRYFDGSVSLVAGFGVSVSDALAISFSTNPWQIFKRRQFALTDVPDDVRFLPVEKPWKKQPPAGTPIDWSNPLTQGLLFFAPVDQFGRDAVSGEAPTSLGVGGQIRLEHNAGNLGSGWCFDTRGGVESGDGEGFYWGTGLKNGTFPKDFYNRGQGSLGWTTMTWARRESDTVAWQMYFGVARDGNNYYQGCLVRDGTNNEVVLRMQDATGSDSALLGGTDFAIRASGVDHWVGTMQNTGSASRMTLYKNGVVSETLIIGSGRSVELDAISTNECGIVANAYALNADPLDGITMANAIWNRELSAAEVASLYENPWQIFKPQIIYAPADVALPDLATFERDW